MAIEAMTALATLKKVFAVGSAAYKVREKWGLTSDELSAVEGFLGAIGSLRGTVESSPLRLAATHAVLVVRAFGTACNRHWAGNPIMAPGFGRSVRVPTILRNKADVAREAEVETRLKFAMGKLGPQSGGSSHADFDTIDAMLGDVLNSPCYRALWTAFSDPNLDDGDQPKLLELGDPGARLEFERHFRLAYAEAMGSEPGGALARALIEQEGDQAAILREMVVRYVSTWKEHHVFGQADTPGVPAMPLGEMYVEPNATHDEGRDKELAPIRRPVRTLVQALLKEGHKIVVVRGDFGQGKSLTARTLACDWATDYLTDRTTLSADLAYPLFIKCGEDFPSHEPSLDKVMRRALQRQARLVGIDRSEDHAAVAPPPEELRATYILDGLDEIALTPNEVEKFFETLKARLGARRCAVVFSRRGVLPQREKMAGIPIVDLEPLATEPDGGQVADWLGRWNQLSGKAAITADELERRGLLEIVKTPILLFMTALTWDHDSGEKGESTRADIYEKFFRQIASGKCEQDKGTSHGPILDAADRLLVAIRSRNNQFAIDQAPADARVLGMLWMLGRVAWEERRRDGNITNYDVAAILRNQLGIVNDSSALEVVHIGVLLVLQADRAGSNGQILFGHKSFREFLVARHWAAILRQLADAWRARDRDAETRLEGELLGARLMDEEDESFGFLLQIIGGQEWSDEQRSHLASWAAACFNDEKPNFESPADSWTKDRRPFLREAALAIGCSLGNDVRASGPTTIRSMLAWFWLRGLATKIVARGIRSPRADLNGADLNGSDLRGSKFENAEFTGAKLMYANLTGADLSRAQLVGVNLYGATLIGASLKEAQLPLANLVHGTFESADLSGSSLIGANMASANFRNAAFVGANLMGAQLKGADLSGANLSGAKLLDRTQAAVAATAGLTRTPEIAPARLAGAQYDKETTWPNDFDPSAAGALLVPESPDAGLNDDPLSDRGPSTGSSAVVE